MEFEINRILEVDIFNRFGIGIELPRRARPLMDEYDDILFDDGC